MSEPFSDTGCKMPQGPNLFIEQLALLLAADGQVTVSKNGRYYVLRSNEHKVTFPQQLVPDLHQSYELRKAAAAALGHPMLAKKTK